MQPTNDKNLNSEIETTQGFGRQFPTFLPTNDKNLNSEIETNIAQSSKFVVG